MSGMVWKTERMGMRMRMRMRMRIWMTMMRKNANSFLAFVCVSCEVVGRRVCAGRGK